MDPRSFRNLHGAGRITSNEVAGGGYGSWLDTHDDLQQGEGFFSAFKRFGQRASNAYSSNLGTAVRNLIPGTHPHSTKAYPGERHQPLFHQGTVEYDRNKPANIMSTANFSGPATQVISRLKRGDQGITEVDRIARRHDVDFSLINARRGRGEITEEEAIKQVRAADNRMLRNLTRAEQMKLDSRKNIAPAMAGIAGKVIGEEVGKLPKAAFSGIQTAKASDYTDEQLRLLEDEQKKMEQAGYGKASKGLTKLLNPGDALKLEMLSDLAKEEKQRRVPKKGGKIFYKTAVQPNKYFGTISNPTQQRRTDLSDILKAIRKPISQKMEGKGKK